MKSAFQKCDRPGYPDFSGRAPWALVTGAGPFNCCRRYDRLDRQFLPSLYPFGRNTLRCRFKIWAISKYMLIRLIENLKIKFQGSKLLDTEIFKALPTNYLSGFGRNAKEAAFNSGRRGNKEIWILDFFSRSKEILQSG